LVSVDGEGTHDEAYILRAAGVLLANEVQSCTHIMLPWSFLIC